ncbi:MAG: carbohydrate ABC transporter permease [Alphaproteobacteria bacterium]|nr:carbohydrate ABC transporter permease [Alphaproteobacteria bacterium]
MATRELTLDTAPRDEVLEQTSTRAATARRLVTTASYIAVLTYLAFCLAPLLFMVLASLKSDVEIFDPHALLRFTPTFANYQEVLTGSTGAAQSAGSYMGASTGPRALLASAIVTIASTVLAIVFGSAAAYGLARYSFRGSRDLAFFILSTRMAPPIAFVLPMFLVFKALNLLDTYFVLIIVYTGMNMSFVVWLLRGFFQEIPIELEESALLDGYGRLAVFRKIALPLAKPGIIAAAIFSAIFAWNEFLFAAILTADNVRTLPVAITGFSTSMGIRWGAFMATAAVGIIPIFILTVLLQRHLVRGLTFGAVK